MLDQMPNPFEVLAKMFQIILSWLLRITLVGKGAIVVSILLAVGIFYAGKRLISQSKKNLIPCWIFFVFAWITAWMFPIAVLTILASPFHAVPSPELHHHSWALFLLPLTQFVAGIAFIRWKLASVPKDRWRWVNETPKLIVLLSILGSGLYFLPGLLFGSGAPTYEVYHPSGHKKILVVGFHWLDPSFTIYQSERRCGWLFARSLGSVGASQGARTFSQSGWSNTTFTWTPDEQVIALWSEGKVVWACDMQPDLNRDSAHNLYRSEMYRVAPPPSLAMPASVPFYKLLVAQGYSLNEFLYDAIEWNHAEIIANLIVAGADKDYGLLTAASYKRSQITLFLLGQGANPNVISQDEYQWTPLMHAAQSGDIDLTRELLKAGARKDIKSSKGKTASDWARDWNHPEIVDLLSK